MLKNTLVREISDNYWFVALDSQHPCGRMGVATIDREVPAREVSASLATLSVPVNTVVSNIVLRGRGDSTQVAAEIVQEFQDFWQRLQTFLQESF